MDELKNRPKVVGLKQSRRFVKEGRAAAVFIARDAEQRVTQPLEALCAERGVRVERVGTCKELGDACGVSVGAAAVATIQITDNN